MYKQLPQKTITDLRVEDLAKTIVRDSIGTDFIINDNLDIDLDFDSPELLKLQQKTTKIIGQSNLFLCVNGEIEVVNNSQHCVMHRRDVAYVQSGHIGEIIKFSRDARFCLLACSDNFYMPPLTGVEQAAFRRELVTHPVAQLSEPQFKAFDVIYKMIRNALSKRDEVHFVRRTVQGFLQALYFMVFSAYQTEAGASSQLATARQEEIFHRFIKLVEKNYTVERNIGFYADKLCITPKYLSQLIYKASGIYAGDHIDNYVISEAKMLIKSRKYTIAQVSDMLNFTSQAYFGRYFKKHTGMTPLEFADKG